MALADQVGQLRQRPQRRVIRRGAHPDELAVGAMALAPADRHPLVKRPVQLGR
jgi:hypothetical protein